MTLRFAALALLAIPLHPSIAAQSWIQLSPTAAPTARWQHTMSFDLGRNRFVVFGGRDGNNAYLADTWEYDGTTWVQIPTATTPPARWLSEMAFNRSTGRSVMFGGRSSSAQTMNDTWLWNGTDWTGATPQTVPPSRVNPTLAYDTNRQVIVMFGGSDGGLVYFNDTWEWDGVDWTQVATPQSPSGRATHMTYDSLRQRMVVFGGATAINVFDNQTWEYDGSTWALITTATTPSLRAGNTLDYDELRQHIVMYGGFSPSFQTLSDNWQYDGTNWLPVTVSPNLPARRDMDNTMYNLNTGQVFMWGGKIGNTVTDETWVFQGNTTGVFANSGQVCGSAPTMVGTTPTIAQTFDLTFGNLGSSIGVVIAFGLSNTSWNGQALPFNLAAIGLPTCNLRTSADFLDLAIATGGSATYSWTVPNDPTFINQSVFCQGLAINVVPTLTFQGTTGLGHLVIGN